MEYTRITIETKDHVLLMGLNRPEKQNAFDLEMYDEVAAAFKELDHNPDLRCGLIFAHGKHFTSGLELDKFAARFSGEKMIIPDDYIDFMGYDEEKRCRKPVVMAIQGRCYTIGFEMMLAQDIRVVSTDARIAALEVKRGIYPVGGGTVRLFQEIGWGNAMRYILTGDEISGAEAFRMGLAQALTEPGKEFDCALEIATNIAKRAPLGVMAALKSARFTKKKGDQAALDRLIPDLIPIMASEDAMEGMLSFMERREAMFKGK